MEALSIFLTILTLLVGAFALFFLAVWLYARIAGLRERKYLHAPGEQFPVNGHLVHVMQHGDGPVTLVLLGSGGTCCPELDFRRLAENLSANFCVIVPEHAGCGYSEDAKGKRDIDSLVEEDRTIVRRFCPDGKYILCPHSMAGIEALRWVQMYPDEVLGLVALDIAPPQVYYSSEISRTGSWLGERLADAGIYRLFPMLVNSQPQLVSGRLSNIECEEFKALFYRHSMARAPRNEAKAVWAGAQCVQKTGLPQLPTLVISSNGKWFASREGADWKTFQMDFAEEINAQPPVFMESGHYLQQEQPEATAEAICSWVLKTFFL